MKAVLVRTGSGSIQPPVYSGSPKVAISDKSHVASPRVAMHLGMNDRKDFPARSIRRAVSESEVLRSETDAYGRFIRLRSVAAQHFSTSIPEEEYLNESAVDDGSLSILKQVGFDGANYARVWPETGIPPEDLGFYDGGIGKGRKVGGGGGSGGGDFLNANFKGGNSDGGKIGAYYQEMLKSNPSDPLLLRNYGKFLHEVEKDMVRAEEYYGRAILASPGDGEVLSLYGKLIWETQKDEVRAKSYFDQAVQAAPEDCMVLGSYAQFMWEAGDDEEDEETGIKPAEISTAMVEAF